MAYGFYVGGVQITNSNYTDIIGAIKKEDKDRITVNTGGSITYDPGSQTLTLKNVTIKRDGSKNRGITNESETNLKVIFEGTVTLDAEDASPILCKANTTLKCANGGKVTLYTSNSDGLTANGCTITIIDADMTIEANSKLGIMSDNDNGTVKIVNSKVTVTAKTGAVGRLLSLQITYASVVTFNGNNSAVTVNELQVFSIGEDIQIYSPTGAHFDDSKHAIVTSSYPNGYKGTIKFTTTAVPVNSSTFPDSNFKQWVINNADTDKDNYLVKYEIKRQTGINISEKNISNLKGIEHFTSLRTLICSDNNLKTLSLTNNKTIESLNCNNNNQLTELDISGCSKLTTLFILKNTNNLKSLNVSGCTALESLEINVDQLKSLNASGCTALYELYCSESQLTSLNVSGCTALQYLKCYDNQLSSLDVSSCTQLKELDCNNNILTSLKVADSPQLLRKLYCQENKLSAQAFNTILSKKIGYNSGCEIRVQDQTSSTEQNEFYDYHVTLAKKNNWIPYYWYYGWKEYEEPSIATDIGAVTAQEKTTDGNVLRYNLQGQRVSKDYRGVVIINGHKVRVK